MAEHDVGELVVAVHDARLVVCGAGGRAATSAAASRPGRSRNWTAARWAIQRSTWRSWKPSGLPKPSRPRASQSTWDSLAMPSTSSKARPRRRLEVGRRRARATRRRPDGRPAVDELHQVEAAAQHRRGRRRRPRTRAWGTSVSASAASSRYSRSMVSLRPWRDDARAAGAGPAVAAPA